MKSRKYPISRVLDISPSLLLILFLYLRICGGLAMKSLCKFSSLMWKKALQKTVFFFHKRPRTLRSLLIVTTPINTYGCTLRCVYLCVYALQHVATHCNALCWQKVPTAAPTAAHFYVILCVHTLHAATHRNILQRTATHCNTLQLWIAPTAAQFSVYLHLCVCPAADMYLTYCMQHTATHCNTLQQHTTHVYMIYGIHAHEYIHTPSPHK